MVQTTDWLIAVQLFITSDHMSGVDRSMQRVASLAVTIADETGVESFARSKHLVTANRLYNKEFSTDLNSINKLNYATKK